MLVAPQRLSAALVCLAAAFLTSACGGAGSSREASGAELYRACVSCHGPDGGGDTLQEAPAIAGLPQWYIASQLERFQTGLRGKHPDDVQGLRMRPMSLQVATEAQRLAVAEYVAGLAPVHNTTRLTTGDATAGESAYVMCMSCHGVKGEGNEAVNAPPLAGLDDWYVALQIRKFRSGIRGAAPGDALGPIMTAMSAAIQPEAVDDIAAYVHGLSR